MFMDHFGSLWIALDHFAHARCVALKNKKRRGKPVKVWHGTPDFTVRHFRDLIWVGPTT